MIKLADLPEQKHSLQQITWLQSMLGGAKMSKADALVVATEMVSHGFANADQFIDMLAPQFGGDDETRFLRDLKQKNAVLESWPFRAQILGNIDLMGRVYEPDAHVALQGSKHPEKVLVIFTTTYNNFDISTVLLLSGLLQFGVSIVILKDSSRYSYLMGANHIGNRLDDLGGYIRGVQDQLSATELYFAGYSSAAFAALYSAIMLDARGYLGFSPLVDSSDASTLLQPKFLTPAIRDEVDPRYLIDLRDLYEATGRSFPGTLYYGANSEIHGAHARHIAELDGFTAVEIAACANGTVDHLIRHGEFLDVFRRFLEL